ncbi:BTB/POZ domain-containing protein 3 [Anopheles sinensis]|uniref:BTB/POZ domain-containing protein 3 n=1 Tax=Anopheles sinensis TaxID=74873 RepID=A0A084WEY7_ANOSI|nr:BTB/POZ domain-containing protein 3 [Anopheles sinensis]
MKRTDQELIFNEETSTAMRKRSMVNNEFFADVVFVVGPEKKRIFAHKLLLVMSSEYFYIMFNGNFAESKTGEVVLEEDDPDLFLTILRYIYTDEINFTLENIRDIYNSAKKFMLTELIALVKEYMMKQINEGSVLRILNENQPYGFPCVTTKCLEVISDNPTFYFKHEDFRKIDRPTLEMILNLKQINCSDDNLQNALEIWADCGEREEEFVNLWKLIRDQKRSYNCSELRLFGQRRNNGYQPVDLEFTLKSQNPVSLYGLGMFIASPSKQVSVELKIFQGENQLVANKYDVANKFVDITHVVNLFFEKVVLLPYCKLVMEKTRGRKLLQELNFNEETSTAMRKRSMVNNEFLADVVFVVGPEKKRIFAHKLLLVMSSEYFYIMFNGNFAESKTGEVVLEEDDPDLFLTILRYIYTDEINFTLENIRDIYNSAKKFMLTELSALVKEYMMKQINEGSVLRILNENQPYGFPCVTAKCLEVISDNPTFYFKHEDLRKIDRPTLEMILNLKQINCSDDNLENALEIWAGCGEREEEFVNLWKLIRDQKRSYNCSELCFGLNIPVDLEFMVNSRNPMSLYGLRIFIKPSSNMVSIELKIFQGENQLVANKYDIANRRIGITQSADLFFEKVVLLPYYKYKINVTNSDRMHELRGAKQVQMNNLAVIQRIGRDLMNVLHGFYENTRTCPSRPTVVARVHRSSI